jgi:hypothetical protein
VIEVVAFTKTCGACPAQWEGTTSDGRMIYARYRWGRLTVSLSPEKSTNVMDAVNGEYIYNEQLGDEFRGFMEEAELITATAGVIDWRRP